MTDSDFIPELLDPALLHYVLDCESLGLRDDAALLQVAAVKLPDWPDSEPEECTCGFLSAAAELRAGASGTADTLAWHLEEGMGAAELRENEKFSTPPFSTPDHNERVLRILRGMLFGLEDQPWLDSVRIWIQGDRDWRWLCSAWHRYGIEPPAVRYWQIRDSRSVLALCGIARSGEVAHQAAGDAMQQARALLRCREMIARAHGDAALPTKFPQI